MLPNCLTVRDRWRRLALVHAVLLICATMTSAAADAQSRTFDFAVIGDMPYTKVQEREYQRVLDVLNTTELAFVAHVGDFQFDARPYNRNPATASMPCVEENYKAANIAWMKQAFAEAKASNSLGLVVLTQANPDFENFWPAAAKTRYFIPFIPRGQTLPNPVTAFGDYIETLAAELESFEKPVAFFHGDTHLFRIDKPLYSKKTGRLFENFTRVETFGWPDTHWVRTSIDPSDPQLFRFKAEIVRDNVVNRRN